MQYWYINLARRPDRHNELQKMLQERNFPTIRRLEAMDREDYDSPTALAEAAARDGLPTFLDAPTNVHIMYWAGNWSYMRALREIADQDEVVMLSLDDWCPSYQYEECLKLLEERPDFDLLQFSWDMNAKDREYAQASEHWCHNIRTQGQEIVAYTPKGAAWLLERCKQTPALAAENLIYHCCYDYHVKLYHHHDPPSAVIGIKGHEINDNTTETCYQGNYNQEGERLTPETPTHIEDKKWRIFYT